MITLFWIIDKGFIDKHSYSNAFNFINRYLLRLIESFWNFYVRSGMVQKPSASFCSPLRRVENRNRGKIVMVICCIVSRADGEMANEGWRGLRSSFSCRGTKLRKCPWTERKGVKAQKNYLKMYFCVSKLM